MSVAEAPKPEPEPGGSKADLDSSETPSWEAWGPRLSAALALGLALLYLFVPDPGPGDFCIDDAWIHLSYAKSLRLGDGLSYNPGDWETGFSSPLWVALLAAWPTEPEPLIPVKLLGALLHAATAGLTSLVALELARARASVARPVPVLSISLLAGMLVATAPTLLHSAGSGMEVGLTACLLSATVLASVRERWLIAGVLGCAAQLARPEAILFLAGFCGVLGLGRRRPQALAACVGACVGMGAWVVYCQVVTGWPWPNTAYVKAGGDASLASGLHYISAQVLPWQPWVVGLGGGLALMAAAIYSDLSGRGVLEPDSPEPPEPPEPRSSGPRHWESSALVAGWALAMLATGASRPLDPEILFYQSRYFAIFAAVPAIVIALGLARTHRILALILVLPIAVFTGLQIPETRARQRAQERGVALLHGDPARRIAEQLAPGHPGLVIGVEGAGSIRYRAPRGATIVDIIGLNDAALAHAPDDPTKACLLVDRELDYLVLPDHIAAALAKVFVLEPVAVFNDARWAQIETPRPVQVSLLAVRGVRPHWRARCASGAR